MESLNRKSLSVAVSLAGGLIAFLLVGAFFSSRFKTYQETLAEKKALYAEVSDLLSKKKEYVSEWEKQKSYFPANQKPEEVLNLWVKELLDFASQEKIVFYKLEPSGVKPGKGEKGTNIRLYLAFEGNIQKLVHLFYHLLEKDPLAEVEHFSVKEVQESKSFAYELTLGKNLL